MELLMTQLVYVSYILDSSARAELSAYVSNSSASVLLSQDGVYNVSTLTGLIDNSRLYVIEADALGRAQPVPSQLTPIDYPTFVELTVAHQSVIKWS